MTDLAEANVVTAGLDAPATHRLVKMRTAELAAQARVLRGKVGGGHANIVREWDRLG